MTARQLARSLCAAGCVLASGVADASPKIKHVPPEAVAGNDLTVTATITCAGGVFQPYLAYRTSGSGEFQIVPLVEAAGNEYSGVIPGSALTGEAVQYYLGAFDGGDLTETTWRSKRKPQRLSIAPPEAVEGDKTPAPAQDEKPETADQAPTETVKAQTESIEAAGPKQETEKTGEKPAEKPESRGLLPAATSPTPVTSTPPAPNRSAQSETSKPPPQELAAAPKPPLLSRAPPEFHPHFFFDLSAGLGAVAIQTPRYAASGLGLGFDGLAAFLVHPQWSLGVRGGGVVMPETSLYYLSIGTTLPQWHLGIFLGAGNVGTVNGPRVWGPQVDLPFEYGLLPFLKIVLDVGAGFFGGGISEETIRLGVGF